MKDINQLNIEVGEACQLDCYYCFLKYRRKPIRDGGVNNLSYIKSKKWNHVVITGGEPAIYKISAILNDIQSDQYEILTNGIDMLCLPEKENTSFTISIDGNADIMYSQRGVSLIQYKKILSNIKKYSKIGTTCLNFVITKNSLNSLSSFFELTEINLDLNYFFTPICPYRKIDELSQQELNKLLNIQYEIIEKFDYHIQIKSSITSKKIFSSLYQNENILYFAPYYLMKYNVFYYMGFYFDSYIALLNEYENISSHVTNWILNVYLRGRNDDFLFDPYSVIEIHVCEIEEYVKKVAMS